MPRHRAVRIASAQTGEAAVRRVRISLGAIALIVTALPTGCCPQGLYEIINSNPVVRLPLDESPHCVGGEWWYYTGRLVDGAARSYGVQAVVFHTSGLPPFGMGGGWIAHYAVLEESTGTFTYNQGVWYTPPGSPSGTGSGFNLQTPLIRMHGLDGNDHLQANMYDGRFALDLHLTDQRGPILHGADGYVDYGANGRAFYYSRPQMQATGTLLVDGQEQAVNGMLWFDRQWGRHVNDPCLAWDWFSVRLDDGTCVMVFVFRDQTSAAAYGTASPSRVMGTFIPPAGNTVSLYSGDFTIEPIRTWTSPHTQDTYPVAWQIDIPSEQLQLTVTAVADDQELDARATSLNVYWEGLCTVTGKCQGKTVSGDAYAEMTNYPPTGSTCTMPR